MLRSLEFILVVMSNQLKDFKWKNDEIRIVFYKELLAIACRNNWMGISLETVEKHGFKSKYLYCMRAK